jgi:hypothetical protein
LHRAAGGYTGALDSAAVSLEYHDSPESLAHGEAAEPASRLALGLFAGLVAVLVPGEAARLATQELTWPALLGR